MSLSREQRITLALSKSISASLSLIASLIIIHKIYVKLRERRSCPVSAGGGSRSSSQAWGTTYHHMMLSISVLNVVHSLVSALNTIMVPPSTGAIFAHGTVGTCAVQGMLQQLAPTIVIYMALMNTYFMLKIRYNISEAVFQRKYEPIFHAVPFGFFLITGITGLSLQIFNAMMIPELGCWIGSYPLGCIFTDTCTRGYKIAEYMDFYIWSFAIFWLFLCVAVVLVNSILIYSTLHKQEEKNAQYLASRLQNGTSSNFALSVSSSNSVAAEFAEFDLDNDKSAPTKEDNDNSNDQGTLESALTPQGTTADATPSLPENVASIVRHRTSRQSRAVPHGFIPHSRTAAVQSSLYVASAFFTAIWIFLNWLGVRLGVSQDWKFFLAFMASLVCPSQGLFNLFVFVRPQYLRLRRRESCWSRWKCMMLCLISTEGHE